MQMISSSTSKQRGFGMLQVVMLLLMFSAGLGVSVALLDPGADSGAQELTVRRADAIKEAVTKWKSNNSGNPASLDALVIQGSQPACAPDTNSSSGTFRQLRGWCGPYLARDISDLFKMDGWGSAFVYNGTSLTSCGPNRTCGDADDVAYAL